VISGIYAIENITNHKKYIGRSRDVMNRWKQHIKNAFNRKIKHKLYDAIINEGIENFRFYILEITDNLEEREKYFINKYNTINNGYNTLPGGNDFENLYVFRSKLTISEVKDIKARKLRGEKKKNAYSLYREKITYNGFEKIWYNINWKNIERIQG